MYGGIREMLTFSYRGVVYISVSHSGVPVCWPPKKGTKVTVGYVTQCEELKFSVTTNLSCTCYVIVMHDMFHFIYVQKTQ